MHFISSNNDATEHANQAVRKLWRSGGSYIINGSSREAFFFKFRCIFLYFDISEGWARGSRHPNPPAYSLANFWNGKWKFFIYIQNASHVKFQMKWNEQNTFIANIVKHVSCKCSQISKTIQILHRYSNVISITNSNVHFIWCCGLWKCWLIKLNLKNTPIPKTCPSYHQRLKNAIVIHHLNLNL